MIDSTQLLRARWIIPMAGAPVEDAVIEMANGRVVRISSGPDAAAVDLGNVALIPGLVNAHTHLEFSDLDRPLTPAAPFAEWVRSVVSWRRGRPQRAAAAIARGVAESSACGTTSLGEIATSAASTEILDTAAGRAVVFREVLGLDEDAISTQQKQVAEHFEVYGKSGESHAMRGLSPHAPYSLHPNLFHWTVEFAHQRDAVVAMHLAETREELELLDRGTGPLVDLLRDWNLWRDGLFSKGTCVLDFLEQLARLQRVLVVHGNYLTDDEIAFLAERPQFSVVFCPRTHAYFGHDEHPWRTLLERGVNVAIGTDSRASNHDLNVWNELLFLRSQAPDVPAETLLRMGTCHGAAALGLAKVCGTIEVGRPADLAVVALPDEASGASPFDLLLQPQNRIVGTMSGGRWLSAADSLPVPRPPAAHTFR